MKNYKELKRVIDFFIENLKTNLKNLNSKDTKEISDKLYKSITDFENLIADKSWCCEEEKSKISRNKLRYRVSRS